jgi:hypothetical protein
MMLAEPALPQDNGLIRLRCVTQDGQRLYFVAHRAHTRLEDIITQLANHLHVGILSLRFLFDGNRLAGRHSNTGRFLHPDDYDLEDGDTIDVMGEQRGD